MANSPSRRVYWDSCTFIGLLNREPDKVDACTDVWHEAEKGETIIYTSFFTFAEVIRAKCEGNTKPMAPEKDTDIETFLGQRWIMPVVVDERIAVAARRLMRQFSACKKPSDAIHLATALRLSVDEMHTFDDADLLLLSGKIGCADGRRLTICKPHAMERPEPPTNSNFGLFQ